MPIRNSLLEFLVLALVAPNAFAGAWGVGSFDNDDALDWIAELEKTVIQMS